MIDEEEDQRRLDEIRNAPDADQLYELETQSPGWRSLLDGKGESVYSPFPDREALDETA
jgi:hypothetical protein